MTAKVGTVVRGREIGKSGWQYIWALCPGCSNEWWSLWNPTRQPKALRTCKPCAVARQKREFKVKLWAWDRETEKT